MRQSEIDYAHIGRMLDVSAVRTDVTVDEVDQLIDIVKQYHCICASPMPYMTEYVIKQLANVPDTVVTGVVGFPSGADTTSMKIHTAREMLDIGCKELDMVINVGALKSGNGELVIQDIAAVVEAAEQVPVKAILEIAYLTDDEIRRGSEWIVQAGAAFVKTGTGWGPRPTTVDTIRLIKSVIGDAALIKAAGGIRDLDTLLLMKEAGCDRFGIGVRSALTILQDAYDRAGITVDSAVRTGLSSAANLTDTY
ncbi:deoxyribose-phosphate aldolase [Paenibacillus bovis]|uniref:Deoxyribose-phosphate aldolase n=1 Tax=Paenibacillus bovis TaxID=1616788 RepID=A0A172ZGN2_9BACL|nr:deoxyribose-phosphate aldolase [Paenibacillus bovis]ANF96758.1 deoxyribose-phosphate aldolase [Paenibacillus bovis]